MTVQLTERYRAAISMKRARQRRFAIAGGEAVRRQAEQHAQQLLPVIAEIRAGGAVGPYAIAKALNVRGLRTSRGRLGATNRWRSDSPSGKSMLARAPGPLTPNRSDPADFQIRADFSTLETSSHFNSPTFARVQNPL